MTSLFRFLILILCFTSFLTIQPAGAAYIGVGDTRPAIEEALQQRLHPEQIAGRIVTLIRSADYEEAERILSDLLVAKTVDLDGYRLLEKVYLLLSFSRSIKLLDAWCANSPTSHHPFTVRGMYYLDKARILDGTNQTLLLNEKQRRNFNVYLHKSQADLEIAYDLNPQDPGAPAALTALAIQLKLPRSDMERWFARSVSADPAWLGSYRAKLIYLAPWRYGSDQLMEQFAIQCFEDKDPRSNTYIITLDWIKIKSGKIGTSLNQIRFLTNPAIYSMLSRGLERYIDASPLSPQIDTYQSLRHIIISQPYVSVAAFSDALTQPPKDTELLKGRISTFLESKRFDEAETDLKTLEDIEGPSPFSLVSRATVVYRSRNDLDTGTRLYDDAIESETSSYRRKHYLLERAEINRSYGRYALAIDDFSAALKEDILFEEAYLGRAKSNYALGNLDTALADLIIIKSSIRGRLTTQARSLINTYIQAERNRIAGRGKTGKITPNPLLQVKTSGQLPEPSETKDKTPNNGYREHLISGLRQFYQKDYDTARQNFYRAIASNPAAAKAYFMLGMIAEQVNFDHPKARIFYEQAFRLEPAVPDYILGVARTRYRDKQFTPALNTLSD